MTADELVARVDARGLKWDLYRAALGHWVVWVDDGSQRESHSDGSLQAALEWAADVEFLPVVPRRPTLGAWEIIRTEDSSRRWHVHRNGSFTTRTATKRAAQEFIDRATAAELQALDEWRSTWGPVVSAGEPDVDWRWAP